MKIHFLIFTLFTFNIVFSQTTENTVTLTTSGTGKTLEEAKNNALRSAIEQAFGTFISSKTEILNDQLVSDQITSVSSGNIQKFEIKSESKLPNDIWCTTLTATVSIDKLISFVQAKGVTVEIKGGLFALNVKQQILNEKAEIENMCRLIGSIHEPLQNSFNYSITSGEPKSLDDENLKWGINLKIEVTTNENFVFCSNYMFSTLKSISMTENEIQAYKSLNKQVYPISISKGNEVIVLTFRKMQSIYILQSLADNFNLFYDELFTVNWGNPKLNYVGAQFPNKVQNHAVFERSISKVTALINDPKSHFYCVINLPLVNTITKTFEGSHVCSLSELENLSGFEVKSNGITSQFQFGGFVVYQQDGYKLGISMDKQNRSLIDSIYFNESGYIAGLKKGDVIKKINGVSITESNIPDLILKSSFEDKKSTFEILRNTALITIDVVPVYKRTYMIISPFTFGRLSFEDSKKICDDLSLEGYSDWQLPNYDQMNYIHQKIMSKGIGNQLDDDRRYGGLEIYWCRNGEAVSELNIERTKKWHSDPDYLDEITRSETKGWNTGIGFTLPIRFQEVVLK